VDNERYERGLKKINEMDNEAQARLVESLKDIAPDLAEYAIEFAFGDVLSRPGLDLKTREIVTVSALTAMGNASPQLKNHINYALNVGCTRREIVEIMIQMAVYAGFPASLNGMATAREVFQQRDKEGLS
jgi:4-carboxymuconolactone decarboxylase